MFVHLENDNISANAEEENKIVIKDSSLAVEEYISGLEYPVMIDFVGNDMLVIEKAEGTVRIIKNGVLIPEPLIKLEVSKTAEEGLVGILVNGDDVYLHYTTSNLDDGTTNWFTKYSFDGQSLSEPEELLSFHNSKSAQHNSGVISLVPKFHHHGVRSAELLLSESSKGHLRCPNIDYQQILAVGQYEHSKYPLEQCQLHPF